MTDTTRDTLRSFLHQLWFVESSIYVDVGDSPLPVDYGAGRLHMVFEGKRSVTVQFWLMDGSLLGASAIQKVELDIEVDLPVPPHGMMVMDYEDGPFLQKLEVDGHSVIASSKPLPLAVLRGAGWVPMHVPRWRALLRGIRAALRWGPHQIEHTSYPK